MPNVIKRIQHEISEVLPATIFFLVAFNLLTATKVLFLLEVSASVYVRRSS